jgi:cytochrome P450
VPPASSPTDFDPLSPETLADPYPFYEALRRCAPVYRAPGSDYCYVSRYADLRTAVGDTEGYSSNIVALLLHGSDGQASLLEKPAMRDGPADVLANADPPAHGPQRTLTQGEISTRVMRGLEGEIRRLVRELVDGLVARGCGDWMREFAFQLPMTLALDLVGFPREDRARVKRWCDGAVALLSGMNTPEQFAANAAAAAELYRYCRGNLAAARREPRDNLTGALVRAVDGDPPPMSESEAASIVLQILIAGNDSSASAMGSAVHMLARDPALQARLRAAPERLADFVEEVLRLEAPFQGHFRITRRDCELAGTPLPKGTRLMLLWASGNRDETVFENPDAVDLERKNLKAHLTFGFGIHHCLGAPLARLEARIALEELLARTRAVTLEAPAVRYLPSVFVRTIAELPIRLA